ncbi:hypothetical protein IFR05_013215 [Cadophora sp. M221]|nr:hypothetical protein IFR05_013215 [Cadophora sp. M221]
MDQSLSFHLASSNFWRPTATSSFDFSLPNDYSMISDGFFSGTFDTPSTFNSPETFNTSQLIPYNPALPPLEDPLDPFITGNSLDLVPLNTHYSAPTSQEVVPFKGSVQGLGGRRKKHTGIPQAERDYLDMLMEAFPGCVTQIREDFNDKFDKNLSTPAIGMRIDRRKKEKKKEKGKGMEREGVSQGRVTRSTKAQSQRHWSDIETQNLLKVIVDIQTQDPYERLAKKLNTGGQMGRWSKEEVRRKVETLKAEICST